MNKPDNRYKRNVSCSNPEMFRNSNIICSSNLDFEISKISNDDKVNHPSHYTWLKEKCGIEVIDITRHMDFDLGNAIKYILRCGKKSEQGYSDKDKTVEDLKKAIFYINDYIEHLK